MRLRQSALALMVSLPYAVGLVIPAQASERLVLEVWINGHTDHLLVATVQDGPRVLISKNDATEVGINVTLAETAADGLVALTSLKGLQVQIDVADQKLDLVADTQRLIPKRFDLHPTSPALSSTSNSGFLGTYDFVATAGDARDFRNSGSIGGLVGGTYFSPLGTLTASGFGQVSAAQSQFLRLDTIFEIDEPETLQHWIVGDAISGGLGWSRSVRFGGVQLGTDFALRPDLATMPLPAFFGQTAVPATVDVYVNAARVFETELGPGPFQLNNLPVVTGGGQASVVVRNALGQEVTTNLPFFASASLLAEGLSAYNFDAGFLRRGYGTQSLSYDAPMATATYRLGLTDWMTGEAHSEASQLVQLAGTSAGLLVGTYGVLDFAAAASHSALPGWSGIGGLYSVSFQTQMDPFNVYAMASTTSGHYADLATIGGFAAPNLQLQMGVNAGLGKNGSLGVSWIQINRAGQASSQIASASYTFSVSDRWYVGTTGFYDVENHTAIFEAFLTFNLDGRHMIDASANVGKTNSEEVEFRRAIDPDGGFGYRLSTYTGANNRQEAEATWIDQHGRFDGGVSLQAGVASARLEANGGVVAIGDAIYATQAPDGSVALVKTGQAGVTVFRENRPIAVADADGEALLTGLVPYTDNHISVNPSDYAMSTVVETTDKNVVPARQSGVIVDFTPPRRQPVLVTIVRPDGSYLPAGTTAQPEGGGGSIIIGGHGQMFVPDLETMLQAEVVSDTGSCHFTVSPPAVPSQSAIPRVGPVVCK